MRAMILNRFMFNGNNLLSIGAMSKSRLTSAGLSSQDVYYICRKGELSLHRMKSVLEQRPYEGPYTHMVCSDH